MIGATLTPYQGAGYASPRASRCATALNNWISRPAAHLTGWWISPPPLPIPAHPLTFLPAFNIRDKLHPNDAGYHAMADSIDLNLFK